jgi:Ca-activated chloride channel family protein
MGRALVGRFERLKPGMPARSHERSDWTRAFALALTFCMPMLALAQWKQAPSPQTAPQPASNPTFSVKVNLVRVLVSVKDPTGAPVTTLTKDDFHLLDSNVAQNISVFERNTSLPLSVAVLIDTSGSTAIDVHYETESVLHFVPALLDAGNPQDSFALFTFNWRTNMEVDYSRNLKRAERALHGLKGEGGTSLYDAIYLASDTLQGREGRHVIVVVTDGGDTTSYKKFNDALEATQQADAVLYPIVVIPIENDAGRNIGGEHALSTLAASTGGRIFYPGTFQHLDAAFADILKELRTQYLLGFYPQGVPERPRSYHPLTLKVDGTGLRVSARSGYFEP